MSWLKFIPGALCWDRGIPLLATEVSEAFALFVRVIKTIGCTISSPSIL
jgi:hypothetical protein